MENAPYRTFRSVAMGCECSKDTAMQLRSNARHTYAIVNRPRQEEDRTSPGSNVGNIVAPVKTLLPNLNWVTFQLSKRASLKSFRAGKPEQTGRFWIGHCPGRCELKLGTASKACKNRLIAFAALPAWSLVAPKQICDPYQGLSLFALDPLKRPLLLRDGAPLVVPVTAFVWAPP